MRSLEVAGIDQEHVRLIHRSISSVIGLDLPESEVNILLIDMNDVGLSLSVMTVEEGIYESIATTQTQSLSHSTFTQPLYDYFQQWFIKLTQIDLEQTPFYYRAQFRLFSAARQAIRDLSSATQAKVEIDSLFKGDDFNATVCRGKFEEISEGKLDEIKSQMEKLIAQLDSAKYDPGKIDKVIFIGDSSRLPWFENRVSDMLGIEERVEQTLMVGMSGVLTGAAQIYHIQRDKSNDKIVLNIVPEAVGVQTAGGVMQALIPAGSTVPTKKTQTFTTYSDSACPYKITIFQGQGALTKDNLLIGRYELMNLVPAPIGIPAIQFTFTIDDNGLLNISVEDNACPQSCPHISLQPTPPIHFPAFTISHPTFSIADIKSNIESLI